MLLSVAPALRFWDLLSPGFGLLNFVLLFCGMYIYTYTYSGSVAQGQGGSLAASNTVNSKRTWGCRQRKGRVVGYKLSRTRKRRQ